MGAVGAGAGTSVVAAAKKLKLLAYLPHHEGSYDAMTPLRSPFDVGEQQHAALQTAFDARVDWWQARDAFWKEDKRRGTRKRLFDLKSVPMAILDLTDEPWAPRLAGNLVREARYPASIGKIGCMLGAHQLRFDLHALREREGARTQKELFALARAEWGKTQTPAAGAATVELFPGVKGKSSKIELRDRLVLIDGKTVSGGRYAAPDLERIFEPDDTDMTEWRSTGESFPQLDKFEYPRDFPDLKTKKLSLSKLGFKERMDLMIGWSHNGASASCIRDVGFLYINSALMQWGIYDPNAGGGLWVGSSYGGDSFRRDPVGRQSIGATPLSLARMFTILARHRLVGGDMPDAMLRLLHKTGFVDWDDAVASRDAAPGNGSRSPFGETYTSYRARQVKAGEPDPYDHLEVWSKLGIYKGESDVAYIEVTPRGKKKLSFVLAGLKAWTETPALTALAFAALEAVEATH